ncbi:KdsC family phosphatase [bacterium]
MDNIDLINSKAEKIKLIATDIDGVLTKGEIIFTGSGKEIKIWNVRDGLACTMLKSAGHIKLAWITGRTSDNVKERSRELKIDYVIQGCLSKKQAIDFIVEKEKIDAEQIAYIGDDVVDIPALREAGLAVCPSDAVKEVKDVSDYISHVKGGEGVFRDIVEVVLKAKNKWQDAIKIFE